MKVVMFLFVGFLLLSPSDWQNDFAQAKQLAKEQDKLILLNFSGSDWCAPCIRMKKDVFDQTEFKTFSDAQLILVRADFPRHKKNQLDPKQTEHNEKLAEQYNPKGKFPLTLLLTAEGKVLREWDGYQGMSVSEFINQVSSSQHGK